MLAHALTAEKRWFEALEVTERLARSPGMRPGMLLHSAQLLQRLGRLAEAEKAFQRALRLDPDNVHAHLGLCRLALRRRDYKTAVTESLECVSRLYFFPVAHFLGGIARVGLGDFAQARVDFQTALTQNPNFPQAHLWMARLLKFRLGDAGASEEHVAVYREMRQEMRRKKASADSPVRDEQPVSCERVDTDLLLALLGDDVLVVSGLPRSGTSMVMQMLQAGGLVVLTDQVREADEDNPKGYFEFEAVKKLLQDQSWLPVARGKALKVVTPLVCSLPRGLLSNGGRYRVLLLERDYDEILASQAKMIARRGERVKDSSGRRDRLRREFVRLMERTITTLRAREDVVLMVMNYAGIVRDPLDAAARMNGFAGGGLDEGRMARAVDRSLHRNVK